MERSWRPPTDGQGLRAPPPGLSPARYAPPSEQSFFGRLVMARAWDVRQQAGEIWEILGNIKTLWKCQVSSASCRKPKNSKVVFDVSSKEQIEEGGRQLFRVQQSHAWYLCHLVLVYL